MATLKYEVKAVDGWVKVVDAADDPFLIENQSKHAVGITYAASAPAAGVAYHMLGAGESMIRLAAGHVYIASRGRTGPNGPVASKVVVSV